MEQLRRPVPDLQLPIRLNGFTEVGFLFLTSIFLFLKNFALVIASMMSSAAS